MIWILWRLMRHSHGPKHMRYLGRYCPGFYAMYECKKCRKRIAL